MNAGASTDNSGSRNSALGYLALTSNTTGSNNSALGFGALYQNTTGTANSAFGNQALYLNTTGGSNVAIGDTALRSNPGSSNSALGVNALYGNTTGCSNSAFGNTALYNNTTGSFNSVLGNRALMFNISATNTVAVGYQTAYGNGAYYNNQGGTYLGYQAGYSAGTGSNYNTLLGYQAGYGITTGAYNIVIGQNVEAPTVTGNQQLNIGNLIYGTGIYNGSTVSSSPFGGRIGIGTTTPATTLSVAGNTYLDSNVITYSSSTASTLTFSYQKSATSTIPALVNAWSIGPTTAVGTPPILSIDGANGRVGIGSTSPMGTLAIQHTAASNPALVIRSAPSQATSTFAIYDSSGVMRNAISLGASNVSGTRNTNLGVNAGAAITSGSYNTAVGYQALSTNTSGGVNSAFGDKALRSNNGDYNSAFGGGAMLSHLTGDSNSAFGANALYNDTTGGSNSAFGDYALNALTWGSSNTAVGQAAGSTLTSGSYNTFFGSNATMGGQATSSIAIGYGAAVTTSNQLVVGSNDTNGSITDAYFGQGVTKASPAGITIQATGGSGSNNAGASLTIAGGKGTGSAVGGSVVFSTSPPLGSGTTLQSLVERMRIANTGYIGIGTSTPGALLSIAATSTGIGAQRSILLSGINMIYASSSTSTIPTALNAFSFATSTSAIPFLSFDTTNSRIGILNTAPGATLSVNGTASTSLLNITGLGNTATKCLNVTNQGVVGVAADDCGTGSSGSGVVPPLYQVNARIGIGTSTPGALLSIAATSSTLTDRTILYGLDNFVYASSSTSTIPIAVNSWSIGTTTAIGNPPILSIDGANGRVGIGTAAPGASLDVYGRSNGAQIAIREFVNQSQSNAPFVIYGRNGSVSLEIRSSTSTLENTFVGVDAGRSNTTGYSNSALGVAALYSNTTGIENSAFGYVALLANSTGNSNSAFGAQTLYSNTTGTSNSSFGVNTLFNNTTGSTNSVLGGGALYYNITGSNNSALGVSTLYYNTSATNTVAVGYQAAGGTTVYNNQGGTYLGYRAGYSAGTGSNYNTLLGYQAGYGITTGAYNIVIGQNVEAPTVTSNQQLNIGNLIYGTGIYNGSSVSSSPFGGRIGIGTTTPATTLSVAGNTYLDSNVITYSSS